MTRLMKFLLILCLTACLIMGVAVTVQKARAAWTSDLPGISWWVLGSGGGPSNSGNVTLNATFGQPMVGTSSNSGLILKAGYWGSLSESGTKVFLPLLKK